MALTITVTKTGVTKAHMDGLFNATITLAVDDDGPGPGFTRTFSHTFKQANAKPDLLEISTARMEPLFKNDIDAAIVEYLEMQEFLARKQFGDIVTSLQTSVRAGLEAN